MQPTDDDVDAYLAGLAPASRRAEAEKLLDLFGEVTDAPPKLWGTIIGFGAYHYRYPTGTEGDMPIVSFSPRKGQSTIYLVDGVDRHADRLAVLGPHSTGKSCLYVKKVDDIDRGVLADILRSSIRRMTGGEIDYAEITITDPV